MQIPVQLFKGGFCTHPERMVIQGGSREAVQFPSMFALIRHPRHGLILFDTGYSTHFLEATRRLPYRLYAEVTPVSIDPAQTAVAQLGALGIAPDEIAYIIISHFHGDHVAALRDFPKARFICMQHGYERIKDLKGIRATRMGFLPQLLPPDFESRVLFINWKEEQHRVTPVLPFEYTFDVFGDGSLRFIPLDGHFSGQLGVLVETRVGPCFLIADACWRSRSYQELVMPHPVAMLIMNNPRQYRRDLEHIQAFHHTHPKTWIIPSHCESTLDAYTQACHHSLN